MPRRYRGLFPLDLKGRPGAQGLGASVNIELVVYADSATDERTFVRIGGRHYGQALPASTAGRLIGGQLNAAIARRLVR